MSSGKEIRTQIKSIQNTQKITSAMEMVAASKMRKAQERMKASRPYAETIRRVIGHLAHAHHEYCHPFMDKREVKRVGVILVSTDRGLCGGLNNNLFKSLLADLKRWQTEDVQVDFCLIGQKSVSFFKRFGKAVRAQQTHMGDAPSIDELLGTVKVMIDLFASKEIDELHLYNNEFVNTMTQKPTKSKLLPVDYPGERRKDIRHHWDYIYEPDAKEVLEELMTRFIESQVYQGVVENIASEMASRMVAMKAATDNAGGLIDELELVYNKARQASITQELSEIVSGAAAV